MHLPANPSETHLASLFWVSVWKPIVVTYLSHVLKLICFDNQGDCVELCLLPPLRKEGRREETRKEERKTQRKEGGTKGGREGGNKGRETEERKAEERKLLWTEEPHTIYLIRPRLIHKKPELSLPFSFLPGNERQFC